LDDPLLLVVGYIVIAGCIFGLGFLSLSEAVLLGVSGVKLRTLTKTDDPRAQLLEKLVAKNDFISAIIVGVNVCIIIISTITTVIVSRSASVHHSWREEAIHIGVLFFILVVAEIAPKTYGTMYAERLALKVARPIGAMAIVVSPLMKLLSGIANCMLRLFGSQMGHASQFITRDEIRVATDVGEEEGALEPEEGEMIDSVLELSVAQANDVMVPRLDIVALSEDANLEQILDVVSKSGYSRIPVYCGMLDDITGILYVNDLLKKFSEKGVSEVNLKEMARSFVYVPETKPLDELFAEMCERAIHIAIVVDEYGGTEGLVTIEDILEELVGEIEDEHDIIEEDIIFVGEDEAIFDARERIEEVNEALGISLPEDKYGTVGGLILGMADSIPKTGEVFEIDGVLLIVEKSDEQHIERVRAIVTSRDGCKD